METREGSCLLNERVYSEGEQVCDADKCYVCEDGEWKYRYIDFLY